MLTCVFFRKTQFERRQHNFENWLADQKKRGYTAHPNQLAVLNAYKTGNIDIEKYTIFHDGKKAGEFDEENAALEEFFRLQDISGMKSPFMELPNALAEP